MHDENYNMSKNKNKKTCFDSIEIVFYTLTL